MTDDVALHPSVANVAAAVAADDSGQFSISDDTMVELAEGVFSSKPEDRKLVATHLIALALKLERNAKDHTGLAVAQIAVLLGLALGGIDAAERALVGAGVAVGDQVQRAIGGIESKIPVGAAGKPAGSVSPLAARLAVMKKKPE